MRTLRTLLHSQPTAHRQTEPTARRAPARKPGRKTLVSERSSSAGMKALTQPVLGERPIVLEILVTLQPDGCRGLFLYPQRSLLLQQLGWLAKLLRPQGGHLELRPSELRGQTRVFAGLHYPQVYGKCREDSILLVARRLHGAKRPGEFLQ